MIEKIVAYDLPKVWKKLALAKAKSWYKSGVLEESQWQAIAQEYKTDLFSPHVVIRVLLFIAAWFGLSAMIGIFALMFSDGGMIGIRIGCFLLGVLIVFFTEKLLIQEQKHYKSGATEAGVYVGYSFLYFGILGEAIADELVYFHVAFLFLSFVSIRYHDALALVAAIACFMLILFTALGGILELLPFVVMALFSGLFFLSQKIQQRADELLWEDHFVLFDSIALLLIYAGGNYFVVRELSVEMIGLELETDADIPFSFLFYGFTVLVPIAYLTWGILKKSILFIRVSLFTLAAAVFTLKYYFSLGHPEVSITVAGALLIVIAISLMKYLKKDRNGFTRNQVLTTKWENANMTAFIASQTLGGHALKESGEFGGKGGQFGGGGAGGEF